MQERLKTNTAFRAIMVMDGKMKPVKIVTMKPAKGLRNIGITCQNIPTE